MPEIEPKRRPLWIYVLAVLVVMGVANYLAWYFGGLAKLQQYGLVSGGFLIGMLAMYIAVHVYQWK